MAAHLQTQKTGAIESSSSRTQNQFLLEEEDDDQQNQFLLEEEDDDHQNQFLLEEEDHKYCIISQCGSLQNIINILKKYDEQNNSKDIDNIYDKEYNDVHLLNDYNHLLTCHQNEFETIYNILTNNNNKICELVSCYMMKRNHRNRFNTNLRQIYFNDSDNKDIMHQQFLDKIHCHYFHSFDIGYKITKKNYIQIQHETGKNEGITMEEEKTFNDPTILKISKLIKSKQMSYQNISGLERLNKETIKNKFKTVITQTEQKDNNITPQYSFGYKYFYWDYYKTNSHLVDQDARLVEAANPGYMLCEWYIHQRFENLKVELLTNNILKITTIQWNDCWIKATVYMQTDLIKTMKCHREIISRSVTPFEVYGINKDDIISCQHLVAMMMYCNQDELQNKFSSTYRRIPYNESDQSLKKRHSNYFHFGRLLREIVECFGTYDEHNCFTKGGLFHGMTIQAQFSSNNAKIYGPTSTTTDFPVARNFCGSNGLILEFQLDPLWRYISSEQNNWGTERTRYNAYFDCQFLSDFTNEQEMFFIGGYAAFSFKTIIFTNGTNYEVFCKALIQLTSTFNSTLRGGVPDDRYKPTCNLEKLLIYRLLLHEIHCHYPNNDKYHKFKKIPTYIESLFHNHCKSIVSINLDETDNLSGFCWEILQSLFFNDAGYVKIDLLTTIFSSVKNFAFGFEELDDENEECAKLSMVTCHCFVLSLLTFLMKNIDKKIKLQYIQIYWANCDFKLLKFGLLNEIVQKYSKEFLNIGWYIYCEDEKPKSNVLGFHLYILSNYNDIALGNISKYNKI